MPSSSEMRPSSVTYYPPVPRLSSMPGSWVPSPSLTPTHDPASNVQSLSTPISRYGFGQNSSGDPSIADIPPPIPAKIPVTAVSAFSVTQEKPQQPQPQQQQQQQKQQKQQQPLEQSDSFHSGQTPFFSLGAGGSPIELPNHSVSSPTEPTGHHRMSFTNAASLADPSTTASPSPSSSTPEPPRSSSPEQVVRVVDPYDDFDPFYKSSLTRFVAVLRKEMNTESDQDKYDVFTRFVSKEKRLRKALYDIAEEKKEKGSKDEFETPAATPAPDASIPAPPSTSTLNETPVNGQSGETHESQPSMASPTPRRTQQGGYMPFKSPVSQPQSVQPYQRPTYKPLDSELWLAPKQNEASTDAQRKPATNTDDATSESSFIHLVREKSRMYRNRPPPSVISETHLDTNLRHQPSSSLNSVLSRRALDDLAPLKELSNVLPSSAPGYAKISVGTDVINGMKEYADDDLLSWIKSVCVKWERESSEPRAKLQSERKKRDRETQAHIEDLYTDQEIGYQDIPTLEKDFSEMEAQKQLNEERREYERYKEKVYLPINSRLQKEIASLEPLYGRLVEFFSSFSKEALTDELRYSLSRMTSLALEMFNKIEMRHVQILLIDVARERCIKQAEQTPYRVRNDAKDKRRVKELDELYATAELRVILETTRERKNRAAELFSMIKDVSSAGLGANQRLLDEIHSYASRITAAEARIINLPDSAAAGVDWPGFDSIAFDARGVVDSLERESQCILSCLATAAANVDNAEHEIIVLQTRLEGMGRKRLEMLEVKKEERDRQTRSELDSRVNEIKTEYGRVHGVLGEALDIVQTVGKRVMTPPLAHGKAGKMKGKSNNNKNAGDGAAPVDDETHLQTPTSNNPAAASAGATAATPDETSGESEHERRIRLALEEAKRRNAE